MSNTAALANITAQDIFTTVDKGDFNADGYEYDVTDYVDKLTDIGVMKEAQDAFESGYFNVSDDKNTKIEGIIQYITDGVMTF